MCLLSRGFCLRAESLDGFHACVEIENVLVAAIVMCLNGACVRFRELCRF